MNDAEIISNVRKLFSNEISPGGAFDILIAIRKAGVDYEAVASAVARTSSALDVSDDLPVPVTKNYVNPRKPWARQGPTPSEDTSRKAFSNPKFSFGPYSGKSLLDVIKTNPGYVKKIADGDEPNVAEFWVTQAKLAQLHAAVKAPAYKDTDATGFMG